MAKNFRYFRIQLSGKSGKSKSAARGNSTYRHSMYMQSKDRTWISRNTSEEDETEELNNKE